MSGKPKGSNQRSTDKDLIRRGRLRLIYGILLLLFFIVNNRIPAQLAQETTTRQKGSRASKETYNLLLSGYICENCSNEATSAFTACSAKGLEFQYKFMESSNIAHHSRTKWPYPHYLKIASIHSVFSQQKQQLQSSQTLDWLLWVDADVRIIRLGDGYMTRLLEYAERQSIHVIVSCPHHFASVMNNIFLIRNTFWGRRFFDIWKLLADGGETCGSYDQCHFGIAMVQLIRDYRHGNVSESIINLDQDIRRIAWGIPGYAVEHHEMKDAINEVLNCTDESCSSKDQWRPRQEGPILFVPAWLSNVARDNVSFAPSQFALSYEKTLDFEFVVANNLDWPFALHSKYNTAFCQRRGRTMNSSLKTKFTATFSQHLDAFCTKQEIEEIRASNVCWTKFP